MAAAEEDDFGRAADRLQVARPTVSQHVADLEEELDTLLFNRHSSHVRLTAAGRTLHARLVGVMANLNEALFLTERMADAGAVSSVVRESSDPGRDRDSMFGLLRSIRRLGRPNNFLPESSTRRKLMPSQATGESARIYKQVPQFSRLREDVLLGDVWKQLEMSTRDRILVTCGVLAAGGKGEELKHWMRRGVDNGITLDELRGMIVQIAFYAGWPAGLCAGRAALELFEAEPRE
ncbi:hypothetical protein CBA19CS42_36150 [Caballeronia novacaledonica]|uniref:HTH lysR-type domain-containing protein n=2 Tax=Caballeronia novacaledonica TaxID=1544861 RepID=A0AA37IIQ5_9BURK|nr:hypothetical protein CBA19CS42_36150 [Caballeronia novacaledonica]